MILKRGYRFSEQDHAATSMLRSSEKRSSEQSMRQQRIMIRNALIET
jgi:hypothetical protein